MANNTQVMLHVYNKAGQVTHEVWAVIFQILSVTPQATNPLSLNYQTIEKLLENY